MVHQWFEIFDFKIAIDKIRNYYINQLNKIHKKIQFFVGATLSILSLLTFEYEMKQKTKYNHCKYHLNNNNNKTKAPMGDSVRILPWFTQVSSKHIRFSAFRTFCADTCT